MVSVARVSIKTELPNIMLKLLCQPYASCGQGDKDGKGGRTENVDRVGRVAWVTTVAWVVWVTRLTRVAWVSGWSGFITFSQTRTDPFLNI